MKFQWQKLLTKIILWLGMEILLNMMGLDDLADYSEFLSIQKEFATMTTHFSLRVRYSPPN